MSTGFEPLGFIELAADSDRVEEYRRVAAFNRMCGNDVEEIGPDEIKKLFPLARVDDIEAGFYLPQDGRVNPVDATMALAKGARQKGVKIVEGVSVTGVTTQNGRATGVTTTQGNIEAEFVVNCAGMWARQLGALNGVSIPNQSTEHYYLITEPFEGMTRDLPIIEDPSCHGYYREEGGGLMIGLFEPVCAPWKVDGVPDDFSFGEIAPDWDRMTPFLEKAMSRIPSRRRPASRSSSAARRALRPIWAWPSARRRRFRTTSSPRGSTPSASSPAAASARSWPSGSPPATRARTSPASMWIASTPISAIPNTAKHAWSRRWEWSTDATTPPACPRPRATASARLSTIA